MARSHVLLLSSLTLCAALRAPAQQDGQPARARLFDAPEVLPLTLTADFNALSKDRGESKQEHAGCCLPPEGTKRFSRRACRIGTLSTEWCLLKGLSREKGNFQARLRGGLSG